MRAVEHLVADRTAPATARSAVRRVLEEWGLTAATIDAELVASELVANALMHAPGHGQYRFEISRLDHGVRLALTDGSPIAPIIRQLDDGAPGGRGLRIIDAVASAWGHDERPHGGKTVWVDLTG
jgi:anti-sigma regulatory factor (Ser/Thr protein kinase)